MRYEEEVGRGRNPADCGTGGVGYSALNSHVGIEGMQEERVGECCTCLFIRPYRDDIGSIDPVRLAISMHDVVKDAPNHSMSPVLKPIITSILSDEAVVILTSWHVGYAEKNILARGS